MSLSLKDIEAGIKLNRALVNNLRFSDDTGLFTNNGPEQHDITTIGAFREVFWVQPPV